MSTATAFALLLITFVLALSGHIFADEVRPAYLEISEKRDQDASSYAEILWKQPVVQDRRLPIDPVFDESCALVELQNPTVTGTALLALEHRMRHIQFEDRNNRTVYLYHGRPSPSSRA